MRTPWILAVALSLPLAAPVWAQTAQDQVIKELTQLGYRHFTVSRTWLGRVRVVAKGKPGTREIVLNPSTGVVLRDYTDRRAVAEKPKRAKRAEVQANRDEDEDRQRNRADDKPYAEAGLDHGREDLGYGDDTQATYHDGSDDDNYDIPSSDTWDVIEDEPSGNIDDFPDDLETIDDGPAQDSDFAETEAVKDGHDDNGQGHGRDRDHGDRRGDQRADEATRGASGN